MSGGNRVVVGAAQALQTRVSKRSRKVLSTQLVTPSPPPPCALRVSVGGAKARDEPRNMQEALLQMVGDLASGKVHSKKLLGMLIDHTYDIAKDAIEQRRAELEKEGRELAERKQVGTDCLGGGVGGSV